MFVKKGSGEFVFIQCYRYMIGCKADCKTSQKLKRGCLKFPKLALQIRLRKVLKAPKAKRALICRNWNLKQGHQKMVHGMMLPCSLHIDFLVLAKLVHRFVEPSELIVHQAFRVRFVGFGAEEDEWVNIKQAVRERSVPLEHSECQKVKAGDLVLCFQERRDQAIYYDAHIVEVQRRMHDIRGCRCLFLVRYDHDSTEEKVRLRRLCRRPTYQI
ncbi:protein SAWADEE HOMEODOMAIN HOMOLOG 2-like isoform X10 [Cucumis melo]|uniref:Protein SAWADEE HOMEODOMAIN HOMOLOG 2-like isoform X10 n=1 Tax=Cucumis melo TaxID=3656 RepID=A0ABM3KNZ7_CUCME|nr:protein SAWADEE HOMEODOMAIN HOMOLOG 2-like isoform X10 [Cucumis melo]